MDKLEISISSDIRNIMKVENFIENLTAHFQLPQSLFGKISLSVIEAVNNAILSGNKQTHEKQVVISVYKTGKDLRITVKDEGEGFDYNSVPDPTSPDNLNKVTGRGIYLMQTLSDDIIFENNGATVTLVFHLE